ncbi:hypothetical protein HMPREF0476_0722 [Kingella kingae ATCC 23330]|uniref:Uncharacterized protein n=1 Tax=Kingella kingae ATCC 23330 TaxID=887327 RepID=F5S689_KINKI|nr:hypothetical protein HMPREF0476_0722 [Kingella kingae ATCC 23330]
MQAALRKQDELDFDLVLCFRCLDRDSGWQSKARLAKIAPKNFGGF